MPRYQVYGNVVGTKYLGTFDAGSEEEAIEKGLNEGDTHISLCHQCADILGDGLEIEDAFAELED
jgi:hypothetical protein